MTEWATAPLELDVGYRWVLERSWLDGDGLVCFVMLNPSTADDFRDDATVRRIVRFAQRDGFGGLVVVNLYARRATQPSDLFAVGLELAIGFVNDGVILAQASRADRVVAAWGNHGRRHGRGDAIRAMLEENGVALYHFGVTAQHQPVHPCRLPRSAELSPWR